MFFLTGYKILANHNIRYLIYEATTKLDYCKDKWLHLKQLLVHGKCSRNCTCDCSRETQPPYLYLSFFSLEDGPKGSGTAQGRPQVIG